MSEAVTFFQVAAALLGTILISGVLAESRGLQGNGNNSSSIQPWLVPLLIAIVLLGFVVGELISLGVLLGQPPTQSKRTVVLGSIGTATAATAVLALLPHWPDAGLRGFCGLLGLLLGIGLVGVATADHVENSIYGGLGGGGVLRECPGVGDDSAFAGTVISEPDTAVRATPGVSRRDRIVTRFPTGCVLGFRGFCLGKPVSDALTGTPDGRWFVLADRTVVASANVRDLPLDASGPDPAAEGPIRCRGGSVVVPGVRRVAVDANGQIRASIAGSIGRVPFVGFAIRTKGLGQNWQRLEPDNSPGNGATSRVAVAGFTRPAVVAAVICLAEEVPSRQPNSIQTSYLATNRRAGAPRVPPTPERDAARDTACALSAS